jgi:hypothetical protein
VDLSIARKGSGSPPEEGVAMARGGRAKQGQLKITRDSVVPLQGHHNLQLHSRKL